MCNMSKYDTVYFVGDNEAIYRVQVNLPKRGIEVHFQTRLQPQSLRQGQMSNQGHSMMLHTYTSFLMSPPNINFLHHTVSEI